MGGLALGCRVRLLLPGPDSAKPYPRPPLVAARHLAPPAHASLSCCSHPLGGPGPCQGHGADAGPSCESQGRGAGCRHLGSRNGARASLLSAAALGGEDSGLVGWERVPGKRFFEQDNGWQRLAASQPRFWPASSAGPAKWRCAGCAGRSRHAGVATLSSKLSLAVAGFQGREPGRPAGKGSAPCGRLS